MTECGNLKIDDEGVVSITFNTFNPKNEQNNFEIHGAIIKKSEDM